MERKRKKSKKKILIISLITIFVVLLLVLAYFLIFKRDIFTYKNKITIEVGDTIPSVKDYLYKDNKKVKEILGNWFIPFTFICIIVFYFLITFLLKFKKSINKQKIKI